jgi:hypothetical protein
MNPGLLVAALFIAVFTVALGARQVLWGKPKGWSGAGLIFVVGTSALFLVLAVTLYLVWAFACSRGPCL